MKSNQIEKLISNLNKINADVSCLRKQISYGIEIAKVWNLEEDNNSTPHTFYLIKNKEEYVAAILVMSQDLHWFVHPKHSGKGYLSKALKEVILPYIFDVLEQEEQKITINKFEIGIDNYRSSEKVALSVGFKKIDDINFVIKASDVKESFKSEAIVYNGLNDLEIKNIENELTSIAKRLYQLHTKIEYAYDCDMMNYTNSTLKVLSEKVNYNKIVLSDIVVDFS